MKFGSLALAISILVLVGAGAASGQQAWPSKPVHWIVPYAAGGFADIRARKIGVELAKALGQPIVIENRTGAGGVLGTEVVAKAAPDGYTMGMGNLAPLAVNVSLMKKLPYDPLARNRGSASSSSNHRGRAEDTGKYRFGEQEVASAFRAPVQ